MYFELHQCRLAQADAQPRIASVLQGAVANGAHRPAGAFFANTGAGLPMLCTLQRWDTLDERDNAAHESRDAARHALAARATDGSALVRRYENWILGPCAAWDDLSRDAGRLPSKPVYEMRVQQVLNGFQGDAASVMSQSTLPLLQSFGAVTLGMFDLLLGPLRPNIVTLLAWPDAAVQRRAWARLDVEPRMWRRRDEEMARYGRRLFADVDCHLLEAIPGFEPQGVLTSRRHAGD